MWDYSIFQYIPQYITVTQYAPQYALYSNMPYSMSRDFPSCERHEKVGGKAPHEDGLQAENLEDIRG